MFWQKLNSLLFNYINKPVTWISLASLPAGLIYVNRFLVPDMSTDVISYHLFNGWRGLQNPLTPFTAAEFYPVGLANIPPGLDILNTLSRLILGYRLGTILSLVAVIGIIIMLYKILVLVLAAHKRSFNAWWGIGLVSASLVLEVYFQLATYFIDNINACLVLLIFYGSIVVTQRSPKSKHNHLHYWLLYLGCGVLIALKLTNLPFSLPIIGWLLWQQHRQGLLRLRGNTWLGLLAGGSLVAAPVLPLWLLNYYQSGNPVFPYYNGLFGSPYYASKNFADGIFGGKNLIDRLFWPLTSAWQQLRLAEPHHIYNDYKLVIYWLVAVGLAGLALLKKIRLQLVEQWLIIYFLSSLGLWGLLFGINRYAMSSILLGGLIIIILLLQVRLAPPKCRWLGWLIAGIVIAGLGIEGYRLMQFNLTYDMSWRPTLLKNQALHRQQRAHMFQKTIDLTPAQVGVMEHTNLFLNCHTNVAGLLTLLPNAANKPVVNIIADGLPHYADMATDADYRQKVNQRLRRQFPHQKSLYWATVISYKDIGPTSVACLKNIDQFGGRINSIQKLDSFLGYRGPELYLISGHLRLIE